MPSNKKPTMPSEWRYPKLSEAEKNRILEQVKLELAVERLFKQPPASPRVQ